MRLKLLRGVFIQSCPNAKPGDIIDPNDRDAHILLSLRAAEKYVPPKNSMPQPPPPEAWAMQQAEPPPPPTITEPTVDFLSLLDELNPPFRRKTWEDAARAAIRARARGDYPDRSAAQNERL